MNNIGFIFLLKYPIF